MNPTHRHVIIRLLQGPINQEDIPLWSRMNQDLPRIRKHFEEMGLEVIRNEASGYAYLCQRASNGDEGEGWPESTEPPLPKLMRAVRLRYKQTLFLVLLREELLRFENKQDGADFLFLKLSEIRDLCSPFIGEQGDEKKFHDFVDALIVRACEWGVLKKIRGSREEPVYRVERILEAKLPPTMLQQVREELQKQAGAPADELDTEPELEEDHADA
jgi:hypothetical protein